ncbi:MAG: LPXTG cell wall anchor domain-containing protein [Actinobacteria bacterium]|nr:LPXTG cell wall anchor domain-containing protein [Actinomycetota bacterium]
MRGTGSNANVLLLIGAALLAAGSVLLLAHRRPRTS